MAGAADIGFAALLDVLNGLFETERDALKAELYEARGDRAAWRMLRGEKWSGSGWISIFLSVFDVHVNRSPCAGTIEVMAYRPGKFLNAAHDKASEENERMAIALRRTDGRLIGCVAIAGWVARRIVCYIKPGQALAVGERFGHIRFGSRTDLYLPAGSRLLVSVGQRMIGGETVMADLDPTTATPRSAIEF